MIKITKKDCTRGIVQNQTLPLLFAITISIIGTIRIGLRSDSIWWTLFCIVTFSTLTVLVYFFTRKRIRTILKSSFYIVEDVFINAYEQNAILNRLDRYTKKYEYAVKFSRNGVQMITLLSKKEPKEIEPDYSTVFFSKPGDKVYLLISETADKKNIIRCFNMRYYKILAEDFNYIDGKYYPK